MNLKQEFEVKCSRPDVWEFFKDIPGVALCLPGAEYLGQNEDGKHQGKISMSVGPFQSNFSGAAEVLYDDADYIIKMSGKGVDKKGSSRGKMEMVCHLSDNGPLTTISVDVEVQLSGAIAQIGRTGIIEDIANILVSDFVKNTEAALNVNNNSSQSDEPSVIATSHGTAAPISSFGLIIRSLKGWFRRLFGTRKAREPHN